MSESGSDESFKKSQSTEDEVGNTQDIASENQDSFEETPQISAIQTSTEKSCSTFTWFLIAKKKASAWLI